MSEKNAYADKMKARIDEWAAEIAKLEAKARQAGADGRIEYERQIEALKQQRDETEARLKRIRAASEDAWDDMRKGFENAYDEFEKAVKTAANRLF